MLDILKINENYSYLSKHNAIINNEIKSLFFKSSKGKELETHNIGSIPKNTVDTFLKGIEQIIFEVTQECNLDCKYCTYSDNYHFTRNASKESMDFAIAEKTLELVYEKIKNRDRKEISINFYGGEPLLKFALISEIVNHTKKKFENWDIRFYITTNGTLINRDIIDFFVENKIYVAFSLDGPPGIHNAKRVFKTGTGSFEIVWKNIKEIKNANPDYFEKNIAFSAVHSKDLSLIDMYDFFSNNEVIGNNLVRFEFVEEVDSKYYENYPYDVSKLKKERDIILKKINKNKKRNKIDLLAKKLLGGRLGGCPRIASLDDF